MRCVSRLMSFGLVVFLGFLLASSSLPEAVAQEATPAVEDMAPQGILFEPLAFATGLALPQTGELSLARITFAPGAGFPLEAGDPSYALAVIESGELTITQDLPLLVIRAGALETAMGEAEAGGAFVPVTEEIAAGAEVTVGTGDTVLFPPNAGGEIGNLGEEPTTVLVAFVGPPVVEDETAPVVTPDVDEPVATPPTDLIDVEQGTVVAATPAP